MMWYGEFGWPWVGWLGMIIYWWLIILLALGALKYLRSGRTQWQGPDKGALDYLDEAYAKGEISRDEFLQKREDLGKRIAQT